MTLDQLRQQYLTFFAQRAHAIVPSSPLVPENDPTTLFTGSGMQPMVPYLLGQPHPEGNRIVDSQKCFRSQDIEEVGDNRHSTFFEMLGNWSLGDYFKKDQLRWFFEFLVDEVGLDPDKLYVSVFAGSERFGIPQDDESVAIWQELFAERKVKAEVVNDAEAGGMQGGRIFFYPEKKNWWSRAGVPDNMPTGEPGGPDSEVFYDFGSQLKLHENSEWKDEKCHINCDCGRFLEIGNSVFMQYIRQEDGSFKELPQRNVDFGGGLERILAAQNNNPDVFTTQAFWPIIQELEGIAGVKYQDSESVRRSYRVIADHVRAAVMLAADGVVPATKQQGYFARRLLRRAIRYGMMIGIQEHFLARLVLVVAQLYQDGYPDVMSKLQEIQTIFAVEEEKFHKALRKGTAELEKLKVISGEVAFHLYETYGFPFELTQEIAAEKGQTVNHTDFVAAQLAHAEFSRTASAGTFKGGLADHSEVTTKYHTATHLLHAALRKVLGTHVQQKGSNITVERLRFDFAHDAAMSESEIKAVEAQINKWIDQDLPVTMQAMKKDEALKSGAIAFFLEKYPDQVSVYTIGKDSQSDWISKEFCGGPHVNSTGEIGPIELFKEKASSAGVRRIYAQSRSN